MKGTCQAPKDDQGIILLDVFNQHCVDLHKDCEGCKHYKKLEVIK